MITVVIADDQDLVRAGLRALLSNDPQITVLAEARDGQQALQQSRNHHPDVVLMDLRMPGRDGIAATEAIRAESGLAATRVLVLTTFDEDEDIFAAVRAGAAGYLLKDTAGDDLRKAVHTIAEGGNLLAPDIARRLMEELSWSLPETEPAARLEHLTGRERAILQRLAHGETNAEIGAVLYISPATVRTYISRMLTKLEARDRTELAILAHRAGLYRTESTRARAHPSDE